MLNFSANCCLVSEYHIATPHKMYATLEQTFTSQLLVPHKCPLSHGWLLAWLAWPFSFLVSAVFKTNNSRNWIRRRMSRNITTKMFHRHFSGSVSNLQQSTSVLQIYRWRTRAYEQLSIPRNTRNWWGNYRRKPTTQMQEDGPHKETSYSPSHF